MSTWGNTLRERAEITLSNGRQISGEIHLQPYAANHIGQETPDDLLNRTDRFFAVTLDGEVPLFLAKEYVLFIRFSAQTSLEDPDRQSAARSLDLELELSSGAIFEGRVALELPPSRGRALDFLNAGPQFFPFWASEQICLINRAHVRAATPL